AASGSAAPEDAGSPSVLDAELRVLVAARKAVVDGEASSARRLLDQHRTRFGELAAFADVREEIERELGASVIGASGAGDTPVMEKPHR
ncbi:MAG: hypothetical protein IAG13_35260, partial [Deltaproteobacteria bacterium]|nr:hypothetical protein [Nannocystaceae bacterium]